jgi:penicillin-binding protein 1C
VAAWAVLRLVPSPLLVNRAGMSQLVLANDGSLLRLSLANDDHYRLWTPLDDVPAALVDATLRQEDRWFHTHPGVNPWAIVRAVLHTYVLRDRRVGGSTLTMQLARLRFGLDTRTWRGKLRQIAQALMLELRHTKRDILEAYLNLAPYGGNVAGVGAASWVLFGKPVEQLTRAEALSLAVIPKSPTARSPFTETGRDAIATARVRLGGTSETVAFRTRAELPFRAPHLADRVLAEHPFVPRLATTIDSRLQALVEGEVRRWLGPASRVGVRNAAVLLVDNASMAVRAYVGSANHAGLAIEGAVDGVRARRSPGSALKPFLYGLALDDGLIGPETMLEDTSLTISSWNPENFDRSFVGPVSATDALVRSRNLPAVQLANRLPGDGLYGFLRDAGIGRLRNEDFYGLALALGGVEVRLDELVRLYAMLAGGGTDRPLVMVPALVSASGAPPRPGRALLSPQAAFLVLEMLRDNPRPGEELGAMHARRRTSVAWKTGTSFGFRDAWAVGVVGRWTLGVWAGNFDSTPNPALVGREAAGPLFFRVVDALVRAGERAEPPIPPAGVVRTSVCALSGAPAGPHCPGRKETWAIAGRSPIAPCSVHRDLAIDVATGLRACPGQTGGVRHEVYEFWPSHLQALFRRVGIARRTPPPFAPGCEGLPSAGRPLRIDSPQARVTYALRDGEHDDIPFSAVADADGRRVSWFVDDAFVGQSDAGGTFFWRARPGRFTVRAVDAMGRSVAQPLNVQLVSDGRLPEP